MFKKCGFESYPASSRTIDFCLKEFSLRSGIQRNGITCHLNELLLKDIEMKTSDMISTSRISMLRHNDADGNALFIF